MREIITLEAADGHRLSAYRSAPAGSPRAAIVVIQEIFGVNAHIRAVCDGFAAEGYLAIAPAMYDRVERDFECGYSAPEIEKGRGLRMQLKPEGEAADVAAAVAEAGRAGVKVGMTGYCYGGRVAWMAAGRIAGVSAVSGYYGGGWGDLKELTPKCPTMLHFGAKDAHIPVALAAEMKALHPQIVTHVYDADHGFNCDQRGSYDAYSAALARSRTLAWFRAALD